MENYNEEIDLISNGNSNVNAKIPLKINLIITHAWNSKNDF